MEINRELEGDKTFVFKVSKDVGILIEGTIIIWAKNKPAAKRIFKQQWPSYTILNIKKIK